MARAQACLYMGRPLIYHAMLSYTIHVLTEVKQTYERNNTLEVCSLEEKKGKQYCPLKSLSQNNDCDLDKT